MGNAAHAIHPVGAQGFNLGLRDVAVLADVLAESINPDPGAMEGLRHYSEWRRADHDSTIAYSDGLARLFANPSPLVAAARTAGMLAHALVPALRRGLAARAMGYRGRAPSLALGEQPERL
jgi:2-octaprenyl-6-methoxyphenol hydroxylase